MNLSHTIHDYLKHMNSLYGMFEQRLFVLIYRYVNIADMCNVLIKHVRVWRKSFEVIFVPTRQQTICIIVFITNIVLNRYLAMIRSHNSVKFTNICLFIAEFYFYFRILFI